MHSPSLILKVVPQRYPFLMIDRIVHHELRKSATCIKNITFGEEVLVGHFENNPIYPGVLMIEMSLQTTQVMLTDIQAVATAQASSQANAEQGFLLSVDKFRFMKPVYPGDVLHVTSEFDSEAMSMIKAKVSITRDGEDIAKGVVTVGSQK